MVSILAGTTSLTAVLAALHQAALDVTGGSSSLLFEHNPRTGVMQATSGFGLDARSTEPLVTRPGEVAVVDDALARRAPTLVFDPDRQTPELAARLGTRSILLLPLMSGERLGLLAIGFDRPPIASSVCVELAEVADAFVVAMDTFRLRQQDELRRDLLGLLNEVGEALSATLNLAAGLDIFCRGAGRLFGADRTSVWVFDRRARHLVLRASSDAEYVARGISVSADDELAPAAAAMRRPHAETLATVGSLMACTVTVPLRGRRRALGTIVFEGVHVAPGDEVALLDRADELGGQLSGIVENMQLLDEVTRSRRELENAFDSITDLVVVSDRRGRIVHVNHAFASRIGASRDELLDHPLAACIGPDLGAWLAELELQAARPGGRGPATREITDPVLKGSYLVTITDLVNHERQKVGSVVVARDLTPQVKLETERETLHKRLAQSEKLAALGQFIAGIAHELNNPLQGVLGHLELMRATGVVPRPLRRQVQTVYREADRAAKIVRNLLVFAGSRRLTRRPVSLNAVLHKVVASRATACRAAGIEVVRHYDEKLVRVEGDPLLLHQALLNIVMNAEQAVAAAGRAGRIEITTSISPTRDHVVATVRDTGGGIAPEALSRIFEPFYTTKEVGQGTGLGLTIAYGIVQEHGGQILAANHPEGGACVTVELPALLAPEPEA